MVFKVSLAIFLISIGVWLLWALPYTNVIAGITALIAAVALLIEGYVVQGNRTIV